MEEKCNERGALTTVQLHATATIIQLEEQRGEPFVARGELAVLAHFAILARIINLFKALASIITVKRTC